ncbi:MAG TPA: TIGR01244 family sulfur transferase [Allosphingosinicella sp.]|nr:TIGR01244 family sulfur transferase [Allosphingosinicella sp.]
MRKLDERTFASGQVAPSELRGLAEQGFTTVINNRPDGEETGQPAGEQVEAAAREAGLDYHFLPLGSAGLSEDLIQAMADALASGDKTLAFCRSGTRSTYLWALARARIGDDAEELRSKAAAAGYDLAPILPYLQS